jgi:hypothetical protein
VIDALSVVISDWELTGETGNWGMLHAEHKVCSVITTPKYGVKWLYIVN